VVSQGHALGRDGRVVLEREGQLVWVGGDVTPLVAGTVTL
jgi:predicted PhzF superfamily epimerase YddE/YHI9